MGKRAAEFQRHCHKAVIRFVAATGMSANRRSMGFIADAKRHPVPRFKTDADLTHRRLTHYPFAATTAERLDQCAGVRL
jgi:hypothetical protein